MNQHRPPITARITALLALGVMALWPILALASHPSKSAFSLLDEPQPLREVEFIDGDGQPRSLADFRRRIVLLNIWVTWCVPCRVEMPALDRLQQTLGGPDFALGSVALQAHSGGMMQSGSMMGQGSGGMMVGNTGAGRKGERYGIDEGICSASREHR